MSLHNLIFSSGLLFIAALSGCCEKMDPQADQIALGDATQDSSGDDHQRFKEILEIASRPGPWTVETLNESNGIRTGLDYDGAMIHYPVASVDPAGSTESFPIVALCPGYLNTEESMRPWGAFFASHGIVSITLGTKQRIDQPKERGLALLDAIESVRAENTREGSPLRGMLAVAEVAVAGFSMGGGGAQHAAVADPSLKAVVALLPWQPDHRFEHGVPVMILAGEQDLIASPQNNARPHFNNTPDSTTKLYFEIRGRGHFLIGGPIPSDENGEVGAWPLAWLKTFVEGDQSYRGLLENKPKIASRYEFSDP